MVIIIVNFYNKTQKIKKYSNTILILCKYLLYLFLNKIALLIM